MRGQKLLCLYGTKHRSENNRGVFKNVLCSPASGLLSGTWPDPDPRSLPGVCRARHANRCVRRAGPPTRSSPHPAHGLRERSRAEACSPSQGDVNDRVKTVLRFFVCVKIGRTAILVKISATVHTCSFGFSFTGNTESGSVLRTEALRENHSGRAERLGNYITNTRLP